MVARRLDVLNALVQTGFLPLFYHASNESAKGVAMACHAGGARCVEFTNRGVGAISVFSIMSEHCARLAPGLFLGAGSICDAGTAAQYINAGASFIVGPCFDAGVAQTCNQRKVAYIPGCATATEIHQAHAHGVEICKLFPAASIGGPEFVKAILAPMPWASLLPTGGIEPTRESMAPWFKAGIVCAGLGSALISASLMESHAHGELTSKVAKTATLVNELRGKK